jgi:hypothetical protein
MRRLWRDGDVVELLLPLLMRLQPIDPRHPRTVALVRGPLVLMAVKPEMDAPVPVLSRSALVNAVSAGAKEWRADSINGPIILAPFTALEARPYTAYVQLV